MCASPSLRDLLSERARLYADIVIDLLVLAFLVMLTIECVKLIMLPFVASQNSVVLGLPIPILYASAPVGASAVVNSSGPELDQNNAHHRRPQSLGANEMLAATIFISLFVLLLMSVPIGICLGLATMIAMLFVDGTPPLVLLARSVVTGADSFPLIAVPLFILAGDLMQHGGMSRRLGRLRQCPNRPHP